MTTTGFDYPAPGATCRGQLALPDGDGRRPGVAVFADINGVGAFTAAFAERLAAECGMVALAADVYGDGAGPADMQQGMAWIGAYRADPPALVARAGAALTALAAHPRCDGRLAAVGFCFGGATVLALARANAPGMLAGVSFHGTLATAQPAAAAAEGATGTIAAKLLVCHGAEDPLVPPAELTAFLAEMAAPRGRLPNHRLHRRGAQLHQPGGGWPYDAGDQVSCTDRAPQLARHAGTFRRGIRLDSVAVRLNQIIVVIPAKAGTHLLGVAVLPRRWVPPLPG